MDHNKKNYSTLDAATLVAGSTTAGAVGLGASIAAGERQFGDSAVSRTRTQMEETSKNYRHELIQDAKATSKAHAATMDELIELYKSRGRTDKIARFMAERELAKITEQDLIREAQYVDDLMRVTEKDLNSGLNRLEGEAVKWRDASILEKPLIAFGAAPPTVKLGVIATAAALGLGAGWAVHSLRKPDQDGSFADRIRQTQSMAMIPRR